MRIVYFSYFHSILNYGIIFWGNSAHRKYIFKIQKSSFRLIINSGVRDSCRELFKNLQIWPVASQYIFPFLIFVVKKELFILNFDFHHITTRYKNDFHLPSTLLTLFQRGIYYSEINIYTHLPSSIKNLSNDIKRFKRTLKYLLN